MDRLTAQRKAGESADFHDANAGLHVAHFGLDGQVDIAKAEAERWCETGFGMEIFGPLPSVDRAKFSAQFSQPLGHGRSLGRSPRRAMLMRHVEAELVLIVLDGLFRRVLHARISGEASWIEAPCIVARFAMSDDLCEQPAMAAAFAQPCAQAGYAIGVAASGYRADQRQPVWRVGDGAVDD